MYRLQHPRVLRHERQSGLRISGSGKRGRCTSGLLAAHFSANNGRCPNRGGLATVAPAAAAVLGAAAVGCVALCPSSTASAEQDETRVTVYRAVDDKELAYLRATGSYGSNPHQSGKYFAKTLAGAEAFAHGPAGPLTVTSTTLPRTVARTGYQFNDPGLHGAGPSIYFYQYQLPVVNSTMTPPIVFEK